MTAFDQRMKKNKIKVCVDLEEAVPKIKADEISLRHIFIGLITNAIEAMPEGGEIVVTNRFMENEGLIEINIMDTGKGVRCCPRHPKPACFNQILCGACVGSGYHSPVPQRLQRCHFRSRPFNLLD